MVEIDLTDLPIEHLGDPAYICGGGSLIIHLLILLLSVVFSFYGVYTLAKHSGRISKNDHILSIASYTILFIPLTDLFSHLMLPPGEDFWHAIHLTTGVIALFFTYRFASVMNAQEQESTNKALQQLVLAALLAICFYALVAVLQTAYPTLFFASYILLGIVLLVLVERSLRTIRSARVGGQAFSLKSISLSMIPLLAIALLFLAAVQIPAEIAMVVFGISPLNPILISFLGAQSAFYLVIAMLLAAFGYLVSRIAAFYSQIIGFVNKKKK